MSRDNVELVKRCLGRVVRTKTYTDRREAVKAVGLPG
jgi:hypothetical protein